ncbi:MAG: caspase family protein [Myxococcales bacterium]|nr:caspase family protein [Myxococcales bacterium]
MEPKQIATRPRLALLVGNSRFREGFAPLPGVIRDVSALHLLLSEGHAGYRNEHIHLLIEPDLAALQAGLQTLCEEAERLDAAGILLYFSTHGFYQGGSYHLCVSDTHLEDGDAQQTLTLAQLRGWLAPLAQREQVLLLDACRSRDDDGGFAQDVVAKDGLAVLKLPTSWRDVFQRDRSNATLGRPVVRLPEASVARKEDLYLQGENWAILTSASAGEQAWLEREGADPFVGGPHSVFARALLEELRIPGEDAIDVVSLHETLQKRIAQRLLHLRQHARQTPVLVAQYQKRPYVAERPPLAVVEGDPFRQLSAFTASERGSFFGRAQELAQAIGGDGHAGKGWLLGRSRHHILSAASGAGKTSFLQAGLQAELESRGHLVFYVDLRTPHALFVQLFSYLGIESAQDLPQLLERCLDGRSGEVILLLDQFESLFLDPQLDHSWKLLFQQLQVLAQSDSSRYRLVVALREDFVGRLLEPPHFAKDTLLDLSDSMLAVQTQGASLDLSDSMLAADVKEATTDLSDSMLAADVKEVTTDLSDSMLAVDVKDATTDLSDSMLAVETTQTTADLSDSMLAADISEPISDLSDSMLAVQTQDASLDLSDSMLAADVKEATTDLSDSMLAVEIGESGVEDVGAMSGGVSLVDLLEVDRSQWHTLGFLGLEQAREAISAPLVGRAIQFQDELIFALLRDLTLQTKDESGSVKGQIYPPYLQIACSRLYEEAETHGWKKVGIKHYEEVGPFDRLLGEHLRATLRSGRGFRRLETEEQERVWWVLKSLVDVEGRRRVLGQRSLEHYFVKRGLEASLVQPSLEALSERRLLTCVAFREQPFWSLAHDFLCSLIQQEIERDPHELALRQTQRSLEALRDELRQKADLPRLELERAESLAEMLELVSLRIQEASEASVGWSFWREGEWERVCTFVKESVEAGKASLRKEAERRAEREHLLAERERLTQERTHLLGAGLFLLIMLLVGAVFAGMWAKGQQKQARLATLQSEKAKRAQLREVALGFYEMGLVRMGMFYRPEVSARNNLFLQAIRALEQAEQLFGRLGAQEDQIRVRYRLAMAHEQMESQKTRHQKEAMRLYRSVLAAYQKKSQKIQAAKVLQKIAHLYVKKESHPIKNLRHALKMYQDVLQVLTKKAFPTEWAGVKVDQAVAWLRLREVDSTALHKAAHALHAVETVLSRQRNPLLWASLQHNLGVVLSLRSPRSRSQQQAALQALQKALSVYRYAYYPYRWAKTQAAMGDVTMAMAALRSSTYTQAQILYQRALRVFSAAEFPEDWLRCSINLAVAYQEQGLHQKDSAFFEKSIQLFSSILSEKKVSLSKSQKAGIFYRVAFVYTLEQKDPKKSLEKAVSWYQRSFQLLQGENETSLKKKCLENLAIAWLQLHSISSDDARKHARKQTLLWISRVLALSSLPSARRDGFALVYAQLLPDYPQMYRLLQKEFQRQGSRLTISRASQFAEVAAWLGRWDEALSWWRQAARLRSSSWTLWLLHLRWQIALHQKDGQDAVWCGRFLSAYQRARPQKILHVDVEETRVPWQKKKTPQSEKIVRSLSVFSGPFSCSRLYDMADICGVRRPDGCVK